MRLILPFMLVTAACGGGDPVAPDAAPPREVLTSTQSLAPGQLIEALLHGDPGDAAVIRLTAPGPVLDWNLHGHEGDTVITVYEELGVTTAEYRFTPPSEADWWLLLRNAGAAPLDVDVEVELYGEVTLEWQ